MIYVSSSCIKSKKIKDSVEILANAGFKNIELSGGTDYYDELLDDLLLLKKMYNLQYTVHNYFPPPKEHFMINLSSLDDNLYQKSIDHCKLAISFCKQLGSSKYGVHAGFLIDFLPSEAGKKISLKRVNNTNTAIIRFKQAWLELTKHAGREVELYVENNVYSKSNLETYKHNNPFLFTDYDSWIDFSKELPCKLLLDFAHLKVSASSLGLSFNDQVEKMVSLTDYFHISGNDGLHDQNKSIKIDKNILSVLDTYDWTNKTFTLEVYDGMHELHESFELLESKIF